MAKSWLSDARPVRALLVGGILLGAACGSREGAPEGREDPGSAGPAAGATAAADPGAVTPGTGGPGARDPTAEPAQDAVGGPRPNILLILADDLGCGDIRALNPAGRIPTPRLDALRTEGLAFTDAHSPSAVCTPTRYGLLTGRYSWRTHLKESVLWGESPTLIEPERPTIASYLKSIGYRTGAFGKWHLGLGSEGPGAYDEPFDEGPLTVGFDRFFGIPASLDMVPYVYVDDDRAVAAPTELVDAELPVRYGGRGFRRPGPIAPGFRHEEVLGRVVDEAIAFIDDHVDRTPDEPFFVYLPLPAPHMPWLPLPPFVGTSGAGPYGDFVAQIDHEVGRVLDALERHGQVQDTLVIMTSDNGADWPDEDIALFGHDGNLGWRGQKADIHEGGHRVPLIVRWPGRVDAGTTTDALFGLNDLFASLAGVLGVPLPEDAAEDSLDLATVLVGGGSPDAGRTQMVHHSLYGMYALRSGRWKLVEGLGSGGFTYPEWIAPEPGKPWRQLYDMQADPRETTNVAAEHPDVVERLQAELDAIRDGPGGP